MAGLLYNITSCTLLWYWWYISMIVLSLYWYILAIYLYFFIDFIALYYISSFHAASSMSWYLYTCLYTLMIHRHEHIYSIHLPIVSMLSSLHAFIAFIASMLLYFYMIHISLQPPVLALVLSSIWEVYSFYPLGVCSTGAQCTWDTQGIYFLYTFLALYMIYCTNYIPAFI